MSDRAWAATRAESPAPDRPQPDRPPPGGAPEPVKPVDPPVQPVITDPPVQPERSLASAQRNE